MFNLPWYVFFGLLLGAYISGMATVLGILVYLNKYHPFSIFK